MIDVKDYYLPDAGILDSQPSSKVFVWQPDRIYVVLGRSNNATDALIRENVLMDNVEVLKRPSGGETVILSPKMLVIASLMPVVGGLKPRDYFHKINNIIIEAIESFGVKDLSTRGISDISIGQKKILGSAVYRRPDAVFYHAVLNVGEDVALISRYISHPSREPDYRRGRPHNEFVTSLRAQGYDIDISKIAEMIAR